ncbi:hypothetical protein MTO96_020405, partial [Rhipicephalus appendiculatus]
CLEGRQVQEAVSGIFHTLLFHRTQGKFQYKTRGRYSVGTVGFEDVTCDFIDFTYVRCASDELNEAVCRDVTAFSDRLRSHDGPRTGQIWLEFFQKKRTHWLLSSENIPWEVWNIRVNVITLPNEQERQRQRAQLGEQLAEKGNCSGSLHQPAPVPAPGAQRARRGARVRHPLLRRPAVPFQGGLPHIRTLQQPIDGQHYAETAQGHLGLLRIGH